jgi:hypothetical protein
MENTASSEYSGSIIKDRGIKTDNSLNDSGFGTGSMGSSDSYISK